MDTTTGRFTSMDSYLGSVDDPVSLHKYLYANANPVNYIDPTGYEGTLAESEVVLYGMLTITSIMAFPTIDLSLLRNNNISIGYVNESVDLSKRIVWKLAIHDIDTTDAFILLIEFIIDMADNSDKTKSNSIEIESIDGISNIENNITYSKGGRKNVRDSGLIEVSDKEIIDRYNHSRGLEKKRYEKELKARQLKNKQKRENDKLGK